MSDPFGGDVYKSTAIRRGLDGNSADAARMAGIEGRLAALEAVSLPPQAAIVSGLYYGPLTTLDGWVGPLIEQSGNADFLYAVPFLCPQTVTFNQVGVEVTTAVVGGTIRMGLYGVGADGMPASLVQDWGTVDASAIGWRSIPITAAVPRGLYWLAGVRNATIGFKAIAARAGMTATLGYVGTGGTTPRSALYQTAALTAGFTSLPATFGPVTTSFNVPAFQVRAA